MIKIIGAHNPKQIEQVRKKKGGRGGMEEERVGGE
jgi:hypothetical protein